MPKYYVYTLAYPNGTVFYVGKGTGRRIYAHEYEAKDETKYHEYHSRKHEIIRSIWASGEQVVKSIVFQTDSSKEALAYERELITMHRETLANILKNTSVNPIHRTPKVRLTWEDQRRIIEERKRWLNQFTKEIKEK